MVKLNLDFSNIQYMQHCILTVINNDIEYCVLELITYETITNNITNKS